MFSTAETSVFHATGDAEMGSVSTRQFEEFVRTVGAFVSNVRDFSGEIEDVKIGRFRTIR